MCYLMGRSRLSQRSCYNPPMAYFADLHLHSRFARGCSKSLTFENLAHWAKLKGIDLLASADFTHPAWFEETRQTLEEKGDGLLEYGGVKFILGTEVNCNAPQGGRNRRTHMLVFAPSLDAVELINARLGEFGNLDGDGRPTLHLTPRDLLATVLEVDERCFVIPAHAWTPWFGIYGSKSGFGSIDECFEDLADRIFAIETGLSTEPAMNWRVPGLDRTSIVSFSDAHSLPRMGRELTAVNGPLTYDGLVGALKSQDIAYTIEFFPESGKYHHSGHRKCGVNWSPEEVRERGSRCPVCGRQMTLGVLQRVEALAERDVETRMADDGFTGGDNGRPPFKMMVPLQQIISEALQRGVNTKTVQRSWESLVNWFGTEMAILMEASPEDIASVAGERVADGVARVRRGDIAIVPGYDGEYGKVSVWLEEN